MSRIITFYRNWYIQCVISNFVLNLSYIDEQKNKYFKCSKKYKISRKSEQLKVDTEQEETRACAECQGRIHKKKNLSHALSKYQNIYFDISVKVNHENHKW